MRYRVMKVGFPVTSATIRIPLKHQKARLGTNAAPVTRGKVREILLLKSFVLTISPRSRVHEGSEYEQACTKDHGRGLHGIPELLFLRASNKTLKSASEDGLMHPEASLFFPNSNRGLTQNISNM